MAEGDNTPETEEVKETATEVEHTTEKSASPSAEGEEVKARVTNLEGVVNGLIEKVEHITPDPRDKTPADVPWTHRGGHRD
jgi:hypothetical protein